MKPGLATWLRFNAVGAAGFVVQSAALAALLQVAGPHYVAASVIAVETAVLHNFVWHRHWTWGPRMADGGPGFWRLLARFHLTHGAFSLAGAALFMRLLVEGAGLRPHIANVASTALSGLVSLATFLVLDRYVFIARLGGGARL